ncbi:UNVERIFIED_CONTAM: hypothetical protein FKN15_069370 [Acipenser sinensis]
MRSIRSCTGVLPFSRLIDFPTQGMNCQDNLSKAFPFRYFVSSQVERELYNQNSLYFRHTELSRLPCSHLRATASEDNAALGSLQASTQVPVQSTGATGACAEIKISQGRIDGESGQVRVGGNPVPESKWFVTPDSATPVASTSAQRTPSQKSLEIDNLI